MFKGRSCRPCLSTGEGSRSLCGEGLSSRDTVVSICHKPITRSSFSVMSRWSLCESLQASYCVLVSAHESLSPAFFLTQDSIPTFVCTFSVVALEPNVSPRALSSPWWKAQMLGVLIIQGLPRYTEQANVPPAHAHTLSSY